MGSLQDWYNEILNKFEKKATEEEFSKEDKASKEKVQTNTASPAEIGEALAITIAKVAAEQSAEAMLEYKVASESVVIPIEEYVSEAEAMPLNDRAELLKAAEEALASLGDEKLASQAEAFMVHPELGIVGVL